ncbi:MAG: hypothetical protein JXN61_03110 [Sedimentisphaerales bacterium]|nr:hypothetical protein [Sedimentisphaerales bacterium]
MADKNSKKKSGLHKEISSIFDGVPVPSDRTAAKPHTGPEQGQTGFDSPRPPVRPPQNPQIPGSYQQLRPGAPAQPRTTEAAGSAGPLQQVVKKLFATTPGVSPGRQKAAVLLVPVLFLVLVFLLSRAFDISLFKAKKTVPPKPAVPAVTVSTAEIAWQKPDPYPVGLRDPMKLTDEMAARINAEAQAKIDAAKQIQANIDTTELQANGAGELSVKGILFSDDNPSAVIGTRIAHVGDIIAGATITKINKKDVEFEKDGQTWTQTIEP